jgi:hypothetical protein
MMKLSQSRLLRGAVFTGLAMAFAGAMVPAKAQWGDSRDWRWREHERREAEWRRHHEWERRWDHDYWRYPSRPYAYAPPRVYVPPPPVYYEPAPPPGVSFMFGFHN